MIEQRIIGKKDSFCWIDIINPSVDDLNTLASEYNLDSSVVIDCLDPEHFPKHEHINGSEFFILRTFDPHCNKEADTTQELTRKVALFKTNKTLITIHRSNLEIINLIFDKFKNKTLTKEDDLTLIVFDLINIILKSYDKPIDELLNKLEQFEMSIFGADGAGPFELKQGYLLKRKSFVFKRIIHSTKEIIGRIKFKPSFAQNLIEDAESLFFYCEEVTESTNSLLGLHISFSQQQTNEAAQQTNEVIRVLTIFSMFLLPLNVITGIYGMNFEHMPELKWPMGYLFALSLMATVVVGIYLWFKSKGWLKNL